MRTVDLIRKKRQGGALAPAEIETLIADYAAGRVPDYQMAAWLMAVFLRGMTPGELTALTAAMLQSGDEYDLSHLPGPTADKHSTGGVGDKVSLILAPLAAACGLYVPMISGRGLGHTGGTLDKLESIPGLTTRLSRARFIGQLKKIGLAMGGQTARFVPADRKLYALRDVTATVESIPLIAASIMSKKLAEGSRTLVFDVKTGNGAFMTKRTEALELARTLTSIGRRMGRKVSAMITNMDQPLGRAVGNSLEVLESIEALQGAGPADLMQVTRALTARMLRLAGLARNDAEARTKIEHALGSGLALEKFRLMIEAQGGDPRVVDDPRRLARAPRKTMILAARGGYLIGFDTRAIGLGAMVLGAGRAVASDVIDPAVGLVVRARLGDRIEKGQPVFEVHYREKSRLEAARPGLAGAFRIGSRKPRIPRLIHRRKV